MGLNINALVQIHSYKHDKNIHRIWQKTRVLKQTSNMLVVGNNRTKVFESSGKSWITLDPAICFFFKDLWFNIIAMIKRDGIYYYCNLSSPYIYDGEAVKYIDYDLDVKVNPDYNYMLLDEEEFIRHSREMNYSENIIEIVRKSQEELIQLIKSQAFPFKKEEIYKLYRFYREKEFGSH